MFRCEIELTCSGAGGARKISGRCRQATRAAARVSRLVQVEALEDELEQLDAARAERSGARAVGTLLTYGGALGGVYLTVTGLSNVERWMKQQELRDIEEEREITGQYISVDAGDVETAIDPLTGKNLTIVGAKKKKDNSTKAEGDET